MAPLACAFRKIGAAEQHGPTRAPVCSTQTCLIAYTTIKQAKISESPLNISLGTILTRVPRGLQAEQSREFENLRLTFVHLSHKAARSVWACQGKTSGGCGQPQTLPKGEAQTHSAGRTKTLGGKILLVWAGHRAAPPVQPSTAQPPCTCGEGEGRDTAFPVPLPFDCPPWETGVQEEQKAVEECFYTLYRLQRINCNLFLLTGNMVLQELTNIIYHLHHLRSLRTQNYFYSLSEALV